MNASDTKMNTLLSSMASTIEHANIYRRNLIRTGKDSIASAQQSGFEPDSYADGMNRLLKAIEELESAS